MAAPSQAITIPLARCRCPPDPSEARLRAGRGLISAGPCRAARWKPILDANPDVTSKGALFKQVWAALQGGMIEAPAAVQHHRRGTPPPRTLKFEVQDDERADALHRAAAAARRRHCRGKRAGGCQRPLVRGRFPHASNRSPCPAFSETVLPATPSRIRAADAQVGPYGQPARHRWRRPPSCRCWPARRRTPEPLYNNTCYSFTSAREAIRIASVHRHDAAQKTMVTVPGAGRLVGRRRARWKALMRRRGGCHLDGHARLS
ncbi:FCSD flavin-binding domain-containing protein [Cupriavidus basilensis]